MPKRRGEPQPGAVGQVLSCPQGVWEITGLAPWERQGGGEGRGSKPQADLECQQQLHSVGEGRGRGQAQQAEGSEEQQIREGPGQGQGVTGAEAEAGGWLGGRPLSPYRTDITAGWLGGRPRSPHPTDTTAGRGDVGTKWTCVAPWDEGHGHAGRSRE